MAAIDMHGLKGGVIRRKIITAEYLLGATVGPAIGLIAVDNSTSIGWTLFGLWIAGGCLNYIPLAIHALLLLRQRALEVELSNVNVRCALRFYTAAQLWLAVPILFVVTSIPQALGRRPIDQNSNY
ncbi:hypothetical protein QWY84_07790 [Aquisalimonas lutea]|uniref:hypothetical protein n=1 Tax=Aquisalimonas lutea TaxID=1327750 RepID=UPI0025B4896D|nr:hypothetical protein [Aquisalimonas lutea]MDN3517505.1 hypothetical protein [Aquisalimonas lutea]